MDRPAETNHSHATRPSPLGWVVRLFSTAGSLLVLVIMAGILIDIVGRYLFNAPMPGAAEIVVMSITAIVFLQIAGALERQKIIMSDGFVQWVGRRSVRAEQWLMAFQHAVGAMMFTLIAWYVWPLLQTVFASGDYFGEVALITFPKWPIYAVVAAGSLLMALQYVVLTLGFLRAGLERRALFPPAHEGYSAGDLG